MPGKVTLASHSLAGLLPLEWGDSTPSAQELGPLLQSAHKLLGEN